MIIYFSSFIHILVGSVLLSVIGGLLLFLVVIISGIICIIAGYAPANIAAKMNPVEAIGFSF